MERPTLGAAKRDKIRNEDLRVGTKVKDVIEKAVEAKGMLAGHVARMKNRERAKKTTEWTHCTEREQKENPK